MMISAQKIVYSLFIFVCLQSCIPVSQITIPSLRNKSAIAVTKIFPEYVNANGGDSINITGTELNDVQSITINDQTCSNLNHISNNEITCTPPSNGGIAALADVNLIGKKASLTAKDALTYSLVLGQPDSKSGDLYRSRTFSQPTFVKVMGGKFFVSDFSYNRVLIWNTIPTSPYTSPDIILGQPTEFTTAINYPTLSKSSLNNARSVWSDGVKLVISDTFNNRVLIWNTFPTTNAQPADLVLGQPDFASNAINNGPNTPACGNVVGTNACSLNKPSQVHFVEDKFIVLDQENSRLLIWNGWPTSNQQPADSVVGQPNFVSSTANNGPLSAGCGAAGRNACSFSKPLYFTYSGGKLLMSDAGNNRVLIFNSIPLTHGTPANIVLGQASFTTASTSGPATVPCGGVAGVNSCSFNTPLDIDTDGTNLFVADYTNHRILGWSSFPTTNQTPADIVLGQDSFTAKLVHKGARYPSNSSLNLPQSVQLYNNKLWVADRYNSRVLRFSSLSSFSTADLILGHKTFSETMPGKFGSASNDLFRTSEAFYDGTYTVIVDRYNNRVLLETGLPTTLDDDSHRITLGQPDSVVGLPNNGPNTAPCGGVIGANACSLSSPMGAIRVGNKIAVADFSNNRVLIWNSIPAYNQQPADIVLGQPNFTSNTPNNGPNTALCGSSLGINKCSLFEPIGLASDGTNLIVTDFSNQRVLIWNSFPSTNQAPADVVLGQPDFISNTSNNGPNTATCDNVAGINRCSLYMPFFVKIHLGKLIIADQFNNRVLIWNSIPSVNQAPADVVIGHNDFTSGSASALNLARGVCVTDSGRLIVSDTGNSRLLVFNQIPISNNPSPDVIIGQDSLTGILAYSGKNANAGNFNLPYGVSCFEESVFISDYQSSRTLFFPIKISP
ncbi:IPT/TIG domain-containing protein [Bacteriovorax sp. PP10]|uniref:IPT/TIG domain-containing protein n=1 Tax=Bacteriovorax antarcticus TaxID=3088717 RepID=A0ABU5VPQ0_9BACT|nr:IPT/TIG domain-containing protein [Bacteriovorax sp. PP10]MEA9355015.1 IPT/TIG domain-containing protein [Bacteriovorax sp. PP10]